MQFNRHRVSGRANLVQQCCARDTALLAVLAVLLSACSPTQLPKPTPVTEYYRIVADGATLPLLRALTDAYSEQVNPYVIFTLNSGDSAFLAEQLRAGRAQLGAAALILPSSDNQQWWLADLSMDGVAVIVHPQNPISEISLPDLRNIFSGVRNNWTDYGAADLGNIEVAVRENTDGTRIQFDQTVMGDQRLTFDALVMPSVETMLNYVALKPGAIGYVPSAGLAKRQTSVKVLTLDGKALTTATVSNSEYPLSRTLNLISVQEPRGEMRNFVAWALGPRGKEIAASAGYAPIQ